MGRTKSVVGLGAVASAIIVIAVTAMSGFSDPAVTRAMRDLTGLLAASPTPAPPPTTSQPTGLTAPSGGNERTGQGSLPDGSYHVAQVIDGDTLKVDANGALYTLRLIGLDTPETVDPRRAVQCFGREASSRAKQLLEGQTVRLEGDVTQGDADRYNRLLRYVYLPDGQLYNRVMIAGGYAHEYTYRVPYRYQADFKAEQTAARSANRGLWSPSTCNGDTTQAARS